MLESLVRVASSKKHSANVFHHSCCQQPLGCFLLKDGRAFVKALESFRPLALGEHDLAKVATGRSDGNVEVTRLRSSPLLDPEAFLVVIERLLKFDLEVECNADVAERLRNGKTPKRLLLLISRLRR